MFASCHFLVTCQSQSWFKEIPEEEERILAMFMAENAEPQRTLADLIMQKIQEKDLSGKETGCSWDLRESSGLSIFHWFMSIWMTKLQLASD